MLVVIFARFAFGQEPPRTRLAPPAVGPFTPSVPATRAPEESESPVPTPPMAPPTPKPDDRVAVQLKDGSRLLGKLLGLEKVKAKSSFGEIAIPVDSILGMRMADANNGPPGSPRRLHHPFGTEMLRPSRRLVRSSSRPLGVKRRSPAAH
jgi:hypothetical protein